MPWLEHRLQCSCKNRYHETNRNCVTILQFNITDKVAFDLFAFVELKSFSEYEAPVCEARHAAMIPSDNQRLSGSMGTANNANMSRANSRIYKTNFFAIQNQVSHLTFNPMSPEGRAAGAANSPLIKTQP